MYHCLVLEMQNTTIGIYIFHVCTFCNSMEDYPTRKEVPQPRRLFRLSF
jgi:hypothetical protein